MKEIDNLNNEFKKEIANPSIDAISNITEFGIDTILNDGLIKDFPIIGTIVKTLHAGIEIKNYFYLRKVLIFIFQLKNIKLEKRIKFYEKHKDDEDKIGINILEILDKYDNIQKAELLGKLFFLHLNNEIDLTTFLRLSFMINKVYYDDLLYLHQFNGNECITFNSDEEPIIESLNQSGFIKNCGINNASRLIGDKTFLYAINKYGEIIKMLIAVKKTAHNST